MTKSAISFFSQLRGLLPSLLLSALFLHSGHALAQETCERAGIEFGFFNGVQTIFDDAQEVVDRFLPEQYGHTTPDGQPISYTLYYNDTEGWADYVETFEQRLQEQDGLLAGRFELFFSSLQGGGCWWSRITESGRAPDSRSDRPSAANVFGNGSQSDHLLTFSAADIKRITTNTGRATCLMNTPLTRHHQPQA